MPPLLLLLLRAVHEQLARTFSESAGMALPPLPIAHNSSVECGQECSKVS